MASAPPALATELASRRLVAVDDERLDEAKEHFPEAVKEIEQLDYEVDYVGDDEL